MKRKSTSRVLSLALSLVMVLSAFTTARAAPLTNAAGAGNAELSAESFDETGNFSVSVPSSLPVHYSPRYGVLVADDVTIHNDSMVAAHIEAADVSAPEGLELVDNEVFLPLKLNSILMSLQGQTVPTSGIADVSRFGNIPASGGEERVQYAAQMPERDDELWAEAGLRVSIGFERAEEPVQEEKPAPKPAETKQERPATIHPTGISLSLTNITLTKKGETRAISATVSPQNATNKTLRWVSSNAGVVTVDTNGVVTAVDNGVATITATTVDGGKSATCLVTVKIGVPVSGVTLGERTITLQEIGAKHTLIATVSPADATNKAVSWSSNNPAIAAIDQNGVVTAVAEGATVVTVRTEDGGKSDSCIVTVKVSKHPESVSISPAQLRLTVGDSSTLTATVLPSNATNKAVTWTSSNPAVASVSSNGVVKAIATGSAVITAKTADGGKTAACNVTVVSASSAPSATVHPSSVTVSPSSVTLNSAGQTYTLTATVLPSNATNKAVTWTSSNYAVATVNTRGTVTAVANGTAIITARTSDGGKTATCVVTVSVPTTVPVTGISLNESSVRLTEIGETTTLIPTITPSNATNKAVIWTSSDPNIASVNSNGVVTAVNDGYATVTVKTVDGGYSATCNVRVFINVVIRVSPVFVDLTSVGETATLTPSFTPDYVRKPYAWGSRDPDIATVDQHGVVTAVGNGTTMISVGFIDGTAYALAEVTVRIAPTTVSVSGVEVSPNTLSLTSAGASELLTATVLPADATNMTVAWTSSDTGVATVSVSGLVTAVGNGTATITVTTVDGGFVATCPITVAIPVAVTGLSLDESSITLTTGGETKRITATVAPTEATNKNVAWVSSDTNVATVDENGLVTAVANGTATITATTEDGGFTATCTVSVDIPVTYVDFVVKASNRNLVGYTGTANEELVIPETFESDGINYRVVGIADWAFRDCTSLKSVVMPDSVTAIGLGAFERCSSLETVHISDSATSVQNSAFQDCTSLKTIVLPDSVTSLGMSAFKGCTNLKSAILSNSLTLISNNTFLGCTALESINIPEGVESIRWYAFTDCTSLKSVTLPNTLLRIGTDDGSGPVFNNTGLTSIVIPDSVTEIAGACFKDCTSLETAVLSSGMTKIPGILFSGCNALKDVVIPASIATIEGSSFYRCKSLTRVDIPSGVESIGSTAFEYCDNLLDIYIDAAEGSIDGSPWGAPTTVTINWLR